MNGKKVKKYRVNGSEHFNLMSMYDHLKCIQIDMEEGVVPWDSKIDDRMQEVEELLEKAYCVGATVDWPTLKRIREIKNERQMIRYQKAMVCGESESEAALAFTL